MTTITKDIAAKLAVAFVAVAMVLVAFAPSAQAQTTEELQAMINDLLAQVAALQGGAAAPVAASSVCPYTWTRDLSQGSTGADVMKLQQFLNSDPDTRVAASGAGSLGAETEYYGPATAAAVSKMQVKYRSQVLAPAGLVNPTGYFGPSSRSAANGLCVAAPTMDDDMDDDDMMDDDDDDSSSNQTLSGEASLDEFDVEDPSDDEIEEGAEDSPIAEITLEFTNGDAEISRIDISVLGDGEGDTDNVEPWEAFETFQLWVDGDMIAEENADDEDDYLDEDAGTFRFSGLDIFGEEDEEVEIIVAATVQNNLDNDEIGSSDLTVEAIRFFDADGVATTETSVTTPLSGAGTSDFSIQVEGADDEVVVKTSTSDPDAATLQLEDDSDSDWYTVFIFDLDTDDSTNDIEFNEVGVTITVTGATTTLASVIDDAELVIDGVTIDDFTIANDGLQSSLFTFDVDGDVVVDAGDRVQVELMLEFQPLDEWNEGITVTATADSANVDAEGADDVTDLSGAATGDVHTLRTAGADISPEGSSAEVTSVDGDDNDYATFEIEVEVTAFEQDVYIENDASDIVARVSSSTGAVSVTVNLDSTADEVNDRFEITEGSTETLTLTYTLVQTQTGANTTAGVRMILDSIGFYDVSSGGTVQTQSTLPATDYRTAQVDIVN